MSDIRSSDDSSKVSKAIVAGRRARARSAPDGKLVGDGEPEDVQVTVDMDALFDETGMLPRRDTTQKEQKILSARPHRENTSSVVDPTQGSSEKPVEALLAEKRPDLLEEIYEQVDKVPGTREDLIVHHGAKLAGKDPSETTKDDFSVPITRSGVWVEATWGQKENPPVDGGRLEDDNWSPRPGHTVGRECPECGTSMNASQRDDGGADEGPTSRWDCPSCGHIEQEGYMS